MDKLYEALYDAAEVWAAITMKPYHDSRAVPDELVALCLAMGNIAMAKRPRIVNQSEQLRFMAVFGGQSSGINQRPFVKK